MTPLRRPDCASMPGYSRGGLPSRIGTASGRVGASMPLPVAQRSLDILVQDRPITGLLAHCAPPCRSVLRSASDDARLLVPPPGLTRRERVLPSDGGRCLVERPAPPGVSEGFFGFQSSLASAPVFASDRTGSVVPPRSRAGHLATGVSRGRSRAEGRRSPRGTPAPRRIGHRGLFEDDLASLRFRVRADGRLSSTATTGEP